MLLLTSSPPFALTLALNLNLISEHRIRGALDQCDSPGPIVLIWPAVGVSYRKIALDHERGRRRHVRPPDARRADGNYLRSSSRTLNQVAAAEASLMCHLATNRTLGRPSLRSQDGFPPSEPRHDETS